MARVFLFDVETTGLPKRGGRGGVIQPRIVTISWILSDLNGSGHELKNYIVRPDGFTIPRDAAAIHGITTEFAIEHGVPLAGVLKSLERDIATFRPAVAVAHNFEFDFNVLDAEFARNRRTNPIAKLAPLCTMRSTTEFCGLRRHRSGERKWPTLSELHIKLFGRDFEGAHDSAADVEATLDCFTKLFQSRVIRLPAFARDRRSSRQEQAPTGFGGMVRHAVDRRERLTVVYRDYRGRETRRTIQPQEWVDDDQFVAFCDLRRGDRHFRVSRIIACEWEG